MRILRGIPPEAFTYRLGNRSVLDWVVEQYRVKTAQLVDALASMAAVK